MENSLTVAYFDEDNKWETVSPFILTQLPLSEINLSEIFQNALFTEFGKINPRFVRHDNAFLGESFEDAFRKPYLWIYLLSYSSLESFKAKSKPKIREMVSNIMEQRIEWLIVFIHPLATMAKTQNKNILKSYESIASEINSMFGVRQCVSLYCKKTQTFLASDSHPNSYKSHLSELTKEMNRCISNGICNRIAFFHEEINKIEQTQDYYNYILMKEGLALTYSMAGLKQDAKIIYDEILAPPEVYIPMVYGKITDDELKRVSEITMQEFRANNKPISHLYLRKYIFNCQKRLMEESNDYVGIAHLSIGFVCTCLGLFTSFTEDSEKELGDVWVYNQCLDLAKYFQKKSKRKVLDFDNTEEKKVMHNSVGLMLSMVKSRLQRLSKFKFNTFDTTLDIDFIIDFALDRSSVDCEGRALIPRGRGETNIIKKFKNSDLSLEAVFETQYRLEEALLILTNSLYYKFSQANYIKSSQRYKVEEGILYTLRGMHDRAIETLTSVQNIEWDSLKIIVLLYLLHCYLNSEKVLESVNVILKICKYGSFLKSDSLFKLWNSIENISRAFKSQTLIIEDILVAEIQICKSKIMEGNVVEALCEVSNILPFGISFTKLCCQFNSRKGNGSISLEANGVDLKPGKNCLKISGIAWAQGKMKYSSMRFTLNNLELILNLNSTKIVFKESSNYANLSQKAPFILVVNELSYFSVDLQANKCLVDDSVEYPQEIKGTHNKTKSGTISLENEGNDNKLDSQGSHSKLPLHPKPYIEASRDQNLEETEKKKSNNIKKPLMKSISQKSYPSKAIRFLEHVESHKVIKYNDSKDPSNQFLDSPLKISSSLMRLNGLIILSLQLTNHSHTSIKMLSWEFVDCELMNNHNTGATLRSEQMFYLAFTLKEVFPSSRILVKLANSKKFHNSGHIVHGEAGITEFWVEHCFFTNKIPSLT